MPLEHLLERLLPHGQYALARQSSHRMQSDTSQTWVPPLLEDLYRTFTREHSGKTVEVHLWDTLAEDNHDRLRPLSYPETDVFLVCFAIDRPDTLQRILDKVITRRHITLNRSNIIVVVWRAPPLLSRHADAPCRTQIRLSCLS